MFNTGVITKRAYNYKTKQNKTKTTYATDAYMIPTHTQSKLSYCRRGEQEYTKKIRVSIFCIYFSLCIHICQNYRYYAREVIISKIAKTKYYDMCHLKPYLSYSTYV